MLVYLIDVHAHCNSYREAEPFLEVQAPSFLDPASRVRRYGTNE
jgi:hypothetical protein